MRRIKLFIAFLIALLVFAYCLDFQKAKKATIPTVSILQYVKHPALDDIDRGIQDELKKAGYINGKNIHINYQNAQGDQANLGAISAKFASEHPSVAVGIATPASVSLASNIQKSPVVFAASTDPVAAKLVKNLKHPEANVTGVSDKAPLKKQLQLIKDFIPDLKTLAILYTSSDDSASTDAKDMIKLAEQEGIKVKTFAISNSNDLAQTATSIANDNSIQALFIGTDNTIATAAKALFKQTNAANLPVFPTVDTLVKEGGVASVALNQYKLGIETGKIIVKILKGTPVKDIPVYFEKDAKIILNEEQIKKLHLQIPKNLQNQ